MSDLTRTIISNSDENREPTAEELANAPIMTARERTEIMRSPEYAKSSLVRKIVAASIAKADPMQHADDGEAEQSGDMIAAKLTAVRKLFADPRYKTDAEYRYEVQKRLAELTANDNAAVAGANAYDTNQSFSIGVSKSPLHGADIQLRKFNRLVISTGDETGPNKPEKK